MQQRTDVAVCQQHTYDHERQRGGAAAHRTTELLHRCGQPPAGGQQHQHSHRGNVGGGDEGLEPDLLAGAEQAHHIGKEPYIIRGHGHACKHGAARGAQQGAAQRQADEAAVWHSRRAHQHRILARRVVVQPAAQPAQAGGHHKQCQQQHEQHPCLSEQLRLTVHGCTSQHGTGQQKLHDKIRQKLAVTILDDAAACTYIAQQHFQKDHRDLTCQNAKRHWFLLFVPQAAFFLYKGKSPLISTNQRAFSWRSRRDLNPRAVV